MKTIFLLSVFLVLLVGVLNSSPGIAQPGCEDEFKSLVDLCGKFVLKEGPKVQPSMRCCRLVREVDVNCICMSVTKEIEKRISMEKVFYVAASCHRQLPHMKKCGVIKIGG
ncbi:hypothetical protein MKW94_019403 [Papaver nudicaule]|uniref:Bifunctional inhibitor/plant lipid transfer protein/seed storage helical domain-containing protein n=1 Tax=Papaver nudicaule TaxID=74823 RepID=A0AA42AZP5_PAPNU|nr:hypothetical protein [Papaver nudicaule]